MLPHSDGRRKPGVVSSENRGAAGKPSREFGAGLGAPVSARGPAGHWPTYRVRHDDLLETIGVVLLAMLACFVAKLPLRELLGESVRLRRDHLGVTWIRAPGLA